VTITRASAQRAQEPAKNDPEGAIDWPDLRLAASRPESRKLLAQSEVLEDQVAP
jgi:hypothetical protein